MCVAVVVEATEGPTRDELHQMFMDNPHGAGVGYADGAVIRYHKSVSWEWIARNQHKFPRPYLLHFRWATHGGRARHLSHPFPLSVASIVSKKLSGVTEAVLIHNGVWNSYLDFVPNWALASADKLSDTAVAAYAARVYGEQVLDDVAWSTAVGRSSGHNRMDVTMRGSWTEYNGNMYSNLNWQPRKYAMYAGSTYTGGMHWNDCEYEWGDDGTLHRKYPTGPTGHYLRDKPCEVCLRYFCTCEPTPLNPDEPLWAPTTEPDATAKDQGNISEWLGEYAAHVNAKAGAE